jgi:hypothetical protein
LKAFDGPPEPDQEGECHQGKEPVILEEDTQPQGSEKGEGGGKPCTAKDSQKRGRRGKGHGHKSGCRGGRENLPGAFGRVCGIHELSPFARGVSENYGPKEEELGRDFSPESSQETV